MLREGGKGVKQDFEVLMKGEGIEVEIDEQLIYEQLSLKKNAIWSLLLAIGYVKAARVEFTEETGRRCFWAIWMP